MTDDKNTIKQLAAEPRPDVIPDGYTFFLDYLGKKATPPPDTVMENLLTGKLTAFYVDRFFHSGAVVDVPKTEWLGRSVCERAIKKGTWHNGDYSGKPGGENS